MVLLCNPSNPTGTVYRPEELRMVADFCREHQLFLIADEVYREFVYDGLKAISALTQKGCEDFVVVVDSQPSATAPAASASAVSSAATARSRSPR
jgi:aspartate aminotransferase